MSRTDRQTTGTRIYLIIDTPGEEAHADTNDTVMADALIRVAGFRVCTYAEGTCEEKDVPNLLTAVEYRHTNDDFHCLLGGVGLLGLPVWAATQIDAVGNLAERDYGPEDVAKALETIAKTVPSLRVAVHCGGDYEDTACIATVVLNDGKATVEAPQVADVGEVSQAQIEQSLFNQLRKARRW